MSNFKKRVYEIIEIGNKRDWQSALFDYFIVIVIAVNLFVAFFDTFEESANYREILSVLELITIIVFVIEYILRVWTADLLFKSYGGVKSRLKFIVSFYGIIDLLTFLPYFLPVFMPAGAVAFRIFRVFRILRLFRINAQYDAFNVIINVIKEKKNQIISSFCMVLILVLASSMCMYSVEHDAQPDNFTNAFSGIWWSVSTLLTVGYGDIYPVTLLGKILAIIISFLGVGMVAIPTGIISAGFVESYQKLKQMPGQVGERMLNYVTTVIDEKHKWRNKTIKQIDLPESFEISMVIRNHDSIKPELDLQLIDGDTVIVGDVDDDDDSDISIREVSVTKGHPWTGVRISDLDITRHEFVLMVKRRNSKISFNDELKIKEYDKLYIVNKRKA